MKLLDVLKRHPVASRTSLRSKLPPSVYEWLHINDRDWLEAQLPPSRREGRPWLETDMSGHDVKLSLEVRQSAIKLRGAAGRPIRITKTLIGKELNKVRTFLTRKSLDKLPLTSKALTEEVESREAFAVRRLHWAAECFRNEKTRPPRYSLKTRTGVVLILWRSPHMRRIFEEVWSSLQDGLTLSSSEAA